MYSEGCIHILIPLCVPVTAMVKDEEAPESRRGSSGNGRMEEGGESDVILIKL